VRARVVTYGPSIDADLRLVPGSRSGAQQNFRAGRREYRLAMPGDHNLLNAGAVVAVARELGVDRDLLAEALATFRGVGRRLQVVGRPRGVPVIDPSIAALKRAEYAAILKRQCGWKPSRMWSCEAPPEDEIARFGGIDGGGAFGNRIVIEATTGSH